MSTPEPMKNLVLSVQEDGAIWSTKGELITTSEIAMMANVTRGAVSNWATRSGITNAIFPNPVVKLLGHDLYVKSEIETFLSERGYI